MDGWATVGAVYGRLLRATLRAFWDRMVGNATRRADDRYLLIGDFNAGESFIDAHAYKFMSSDYLVAIREAGFVDLWRARNGETEHTWFSFGRGGVALNGFRIDHALASASLAGDATRAAITRTRSARAASPTTRRCSWSSAPIEARMEQGLGPDRDAEYDDRRTRTAPFSGEKLAARRATPPGAGPSGRRVP